MVDYKPKLAAARDRATKEQLAAKTYQQAISTAKQAKAYEQQNQWQAAASILGSSFARLLNRFPVIAFTTVRLKL